jgi:hypothetical protein
MSSKIEKGLFVTLVIDPLIKSEQEKPAILRDVEFIRSIRSLYESWEKMPLEWGFENEL